MAIFSVRVSDQFAARFDAAAGQTGGRSALLRQLMARAVAAAPVRPAGPAGPRTAARIMVRLAAPDAAGVDREAAAMALSRAAWVAALVRRRVRGKPSFRRPDELSLIAVQTELRRIGVNVNQMARALNTAVLAGEVLDLELAYLRDLRAEIRGHMRGLRAAFEGNLAYWDAGP
jgi:hypothetical protein